MAKSDPSYLNPGKGERERLDKRRINHILVGARYADNRISITSFGALIGYWVVYKNKSKIKNPILLIGPIQIGITRYWCGVSPKKREIFLGRNGKLWRVAGKLLPGQASEPRNLDSDGKKVWAHTYEQLVLDRLCPAEELQATRYTNTRYRRAVKALVLGRVTESLSYGRELDVQDFARGCCESWTRFDLLSPRYPTVQHALYVSLVLSLPHEQAAELVELGALMEYRVPIVTRALAGQLYAESVKRLAQLCPAWYAEGWALDWKHVGSIDRYFRREFARLLTEAVVGDQDLGSASGKLRLNLPE